MISFKAYWVFLFFFALAPVTTYWSDRSPKHEQVRTPANSSGSNSDCRTLVKDLFLSKNYVVDHEAALINKKLLSFSNKFVTINHPQLEWINKVRISLNKSIRNWNNNRFPSFYLFNEEEVLPASRMYFESLEKLLAENTRTPKENMENLKLVQSWINSFKEYKVDIDKLLDERISLQYNISLLKKLKLKDEVRDIKLIIKRDGKLTEEIFTLRKEDKNLSSVIKKLEEEVSLLDGSLLKNGKIKDRIIRQATLKDILTIVHREFEHKVKNGKDLPDRMTKEMYKLEDLIAKTDFQPSTYGVYKVANKQFTSELLHLTKLDGVVHKLKTSLNENEKLNIVRSLFNKITNITPRQAAFGLGGTSVVAIGAHQYFYVSKSSTVEEVRTSEVILDSNVQEQLDSTVEEETRKSDSHSKVIEVEIDELTGEVSPVQNN